MANFAQTALWPDESFEPEPDEGLEANLPEREQAMWDELFGFVALGWYVAPPQFIARSRHWLCVGYNVRGCLQDPSFVAARSRHRVTALRDLGLMLADTFEVGCFRSEHRRLN